MYLDYAHQTARTTDGVDVPVLAWAASMEDVRVAVEEGTDGLVVRAQTPVLDPEADDEEQARQLMVLARAAAGKPVILCGSPEDISVPALLGAAAAAEFTLAVPAALQDEQFEELAALIEAAREELETEEAPHAPFAVAALADNSADDGADPARALVRFDTSRLVVVPAAPDSGEWLSEVLAAAKEVAKPALVVLAVPSPETVEEALALGAAALVVAPGLVQSTKALVRTISVSAQRQARFAGAPLPNEPQAAVQPFS
jgi:hypothetical protein